MDLKGKVALITGASRGIGRATAIEMARQGCEVMLFARDQVALSQLARHIGDHGGTAKISPGDVSSYNDLDRAVTATIEAYGRLDILINNAGIIDPIGPIETFAPEAWARVMTVNVVGAFNGIRAVLPYFLARKAASTIINISSGAANSALEGWSHYCTSKAAVKKLTECVHTEAGSRGVHVIGLSPGTVATDMMASIRASGINPVSQLDNTSHIAPEWVAKAIIYLCGPDGAQHAGTDFSIKTMEGRLAAGLPVDIERRSP